MAVGVAAGAVIVHRVAIAATLTVAVGVVVAADRAAVPDGENRMAGAQAGEINMGLLSTLKDKSIEKAVEIGDVLRAKKGRSYALSIPA